MEEEAGRFQRISNEGGTTLLSLPIAKLRKMTRMHWIRRSWDGEKLSCLWKGDRDKPRKGREKKRIKKFNEDEMERKRKQKNISDRAEKRFDDWTAIGQWLKQSDRLLIGQSERRKDSLGKLANCCYRNAYDNTRTHAARLLLYREPGQVSFPEKNWIPSISDNLWNCRTCSFNTSPNFNSSNKPTCIIEFVELRSRSEQWIRLRHAHFRITRILEKTWIRIWQTRKGIRTWSETCERFLGLGVAESKLEFLREEPPYLPVACFRAK